MPWVLHTGVNEGEYSDFSSRARIQLFEELDELVWYFFNEFCTKSDNDRVKRYRIEEDETGTEDNRKLFLDRVNRYERDYDGNDHQYCCNVAYLAFKQSLMVSDNNVTLDTYKKQKPRYRSEVIPITIYGSEAKNALHQSYPALLKRFLPASELAPMVLDYVIGLDNIKKLIGISSNPPEEETETETETDQE
jgi:hypothetical protein